MHETDSRFTHLISRTRTEMYRGLPQSGVSESALGRIERLVGALKIIVCGVFHRETLLAIVGIAF